MGRYGKGRPIWVVFSSLYLNGVGDDGVRKRLRVEKDRHGIDEVVFIDKSGGIEFIA